MTLSREARIILGIVFVAAAAWLWINYFTQVGEDPPTVVAMPAPAPAPAAPPAVPPPPPPPAVARDIVIAQLPFLVTTAPEVVAEPVAEETEVAVARPERDRRASINPFSPIIVRAAPEPAAAAPATVATSPPPPIEVADVPVRSAPSVPEVQPPRVLSPPTPSPLAPPSPAAANLPRALPSGTLPIAPSILREARTPARPVGPENLAEVAAIRVPATVAEVPLQLEDNAVTAPTDAVLSPITPPPPASDAVTGGPTPPLSAGVNPLSRYLRDHGVTFTGSVLGPIGVGVFRSNLTVAPIVIALGQPLPDTDIVLTDLKGQEAVLSQGSHTETLVLNLRR